MALFFMVGAYQGDGREGAKGPIGDFSRTVCLSLLMDVPIQKLGLRCFDCLGPLRSQP